MIGAIIGDIVGSEAEIALKILRFQGDFCLDEIRIKGRHCNRHHQLLLLRGKSLA